ncbi:histidine phosphatase family protein [Brachybacterium sp. NBEC-018]|uniref:histidine phosphatase family protein n=1 Tax=Brachybacterium sp. NBEC-018 TaxID=2996004 RepID=UPI0021756696|nr:histidine phosphatase family protein [Brachybacterium sp. NBEC-018]UVY84376.1 histidine phosphatase family protein [Brachybacterium sp. NBEC-018]
METILLVRHAEADGHDGEDPPLGPRGMRQAGLLGERLAGTGATRLLHGPRRRARRTAELLAPHLGLTPEESALLEDRTPFPSPDRRDDYPSHREDFLRQVPLEERDEDGAALAAAWERLSAPGGAGTLVAVTHAFVVGSFVARALGAPPAAWMQLPIANASLTALRRRPTGEWSVLGVSDVGHLVGV